MPKMPHAAACGAAVWLGFVTSGFAFVPTSPLGGGCNAGCRTGPGVA